MTDPASAATGAPTAPCAGIAAGAAFLSGPGPVVDFGPGAVARIPAHLAAQRARRVLVVTDPGLRRAGVVDAVTASGLAVDVLDAVTGNPSVEVVARGAEYARTLGVDAVLALRGDSSLARVRRRGRDPALALLTTPGADLWTCNRFRRGLLAARVARPSRRCLPSGA